jgi:hypothetical protein
MAPKPAPVPEEEDDDLDLWNGKFIEKRARLSLLVIL